MTTREPPIPAVLAEDDAPEWYGDELDEAIVVGELPAHIEGEERWRITSRGQAEWAMRKLAAVQARAQEVSDLMAGWSKRLEEWEASELARIERPARFFADLLELYGREQRELNPKEATIRLPSGEIATTKPKQPVVYVDDEDALLDWLAEEVDSDTYEQVVKVEPSLRVSEFRKAVTVTYDLVPWCQLCGLRLRADNDDGTWRWSHEETQGEVVALHDHDPRPGGDYVVRLNGKEMPGVKAEVGEITAKPKVRL